MPQTIRKYWGLLKGRNSLNYNWPIIDQDSVVLVTASEYTNQQVRFIGSASITVSDITPHGPPYDQNHGVTFILTVDWSSPINVVTDITVLDAKPTTIQLYTPPTPPSIGLRMQFQESTNWCWIAVATSISHFYHPSSAWTQCAVMTDVGHRLNGFPANTGACPSSAVVAANPDLKAALANPYDQAAEYILDNAKYGVDRRYLKTGGVGDPLTTTGNYAGYHGGDTSHAAVAAEIGAGRPVAVDITWNPSGPSHVVAIAGILGDSLLVLDPVNGMSVIRWQNFPATYFGGAKLDGYAFTKSS